MRPWDAFDKAVQAEPPQIVGRPAGGDGFGRLPGERGDVLAQIAMGETAGQERLSAPAKNRVSYERRRYQTDC